MEGPKKPPPGSTSGEHRIDLPFQPAGSSLVPRPMSVPPTESTRAPPDGSAPFPSIGLPVPGMKLATPTIRIQDADESVPMPSMPPRPLSLRPQPASRRGSRTLVAVLLLSLGTLAIVRPSLRDLGLGDGAARHTAPIGAFVQPFDVSQFLRGSLHAHTTLSDGKDPPRDVVSWYKDHGYQFLALTDHDKLDDLADFADLEGPGFVLLPAEEITSSFGGERTPVHINGICIQQVIPSGQFSDPQRALAEGVGAVRAQHGFSIVNHPNFNYALAASDIASLNGPYGLEIWSGHPDVHSLGNALHASHEQTWDELLARGRDVTAVGVDDMHRLTPEREAAREPLPGRGWVQTFGAEVNRDAICAALIAGRMYASSGAALRRITLTTAALSVWVDDARTVVDFIGNGGRVLASGIVEPASQGTEGFTASYSLRGGESYVRARATLDGVGQAWTQAYRVTR